MIGGLPKNLGRGAQFEDSEINVLEGDEYDTAFFDKRSKFLHYLPDVVIMNNIEFDHADIFNNIDEIKLSFRRLLRVVPRSGVAIINADDSNCRDVVENAPCPVVSVGFGEGSDRRIEAVDYAVENSSFTIGGERYSIPMSGEFNVRNAAMATVAALHGGLSSDEIRKGLQSFAGIARRQELRGIERGVRVIDDFAHHPTAIQLAIKALRQKYPQGALWILFEPRSNTTRRKTFQQELSTCFEGADHVVIAGVEDLQKIPEADRLDPVALAGSIPGGRGRYLATVDEIVDYVVAGAKEGDTVAVLSNGGFGGIHKKLLTKLAEE